MASEAGVRWGTREAVARKGICTAYDHINDRHSYDDHKKDYISSTIRHVGQGGCSAPPEIGGGRLLAGSIKAGSHTDLRCAGSCLANRRTRHLRGEPLGVSQGVLTIAIGEPSGRGQLDLSQAALHRVAATGFISFVRRHVTLMITSCAWGGTRPLGVDERHRTRSADRVS